MDPAAPSSVGGLIRAIAAARTLRMPLYAKEVIE